MHGNEIFQCVQDALAQVEAERDVLEESDVRAPLNAFVARKQSAEELSVEPPAKC